MLAITALSLGAAAQTTPLFTGTEGSVADRVADAKTHLNDPKLACNAANYIVCHGSPQELLAEADTILTDPTLGGVITVNTGLIGNALWALPSSVSDADAKIALLDARMATVSSSFTAIIAPMAESRKNTIRVQKAQGLVTSAKYADAITLLSTASILGDPNPSCANNAIVFISQSKLALSATDALGWSKAQYYLTPFASSQDGINAVAKALRSKDLNLVRSNGFIQYQKDGQGTNVLDSIQVPTLISSNLASCTPARQAVNAVIAGDNAGALRISFGVFGTANSNDELNSAVSLVAQTLRNVDGNLVRANAFVTAQKNGEAFTITELQ